MANPGKPDEWTPLSTKYANPNDDPLAYPYPDDDAWEGGPHWKDHPNNQPNKNKDAIEIENQAIKNNDAIEIEDQPIKNKDAIEIEKEKQ